MALVLLGGAVAVCGAATLLLLGRYEARFLVLGVALLVGGLVAFLAVPAGRRKVSLTVLGAVLLATLGAWAAARSLTGRGTEPSAPAASHDAVPEPLDSAAALREGLLLARRSLARLDRVRDYTCTFAKRERARNFLGKEWLTEFRMLLKVRHEPFGVYARFLDPPDRRGMEVIYVEGENDGRLVAHATGTLARVLGTMRLEPEGWEALIDHRHPITMAGMRNLLVAFLDEAAAHEAELARCEVRLVPDAVSYGRPCRCLEVRNPDPASAYSLALARVCFDDELLLPVHSERWEHADVDGVRRPLLVERYDYTDVVLDPGLTDLDFDPDNPEYGY